MTENELYGLTKVIAAQWHRSPLTDAAVESYRAMLRPLDHDLARRAVASLATGADEARFVPTAGVILRRAAGLDLAPPTWPEIRAQLVVQRERLDRIRRDGGMEWTCPHGECDGGGVVVAEGDPGKAGTARPCRCYDRRAAEIRGVAVLHPMVRAWMDEGYASWDDVRRSLDGEASANKLLRESWGDYGTRAVDAHVLTLSGADHAPQVRRARDGEEIEPGRTDHGGIRRLGAAPTLEGVAAARERETAR